MPRQVAATEQIQRGKNDDLFGIWCVEIMVQETLALLF